MSSCTLLLLLTSCSGALASPFYGGTMTFNPKGRNPDGSFRVDFRFKQTYHSCYLSNGWYCHRGDCGYINRFEVAEVDHGSGGVSYNGGRWCTSEALVTKNIQSNKPFEIGKTGCCWIFNSLSSSASWALVTHVDLGIRSDTQEPNRSPVTAVMPFIRIPQNCPRRLKLLAHDPDKDQVRCRYGTAPNECYSCHHHPGFYLDEDDSRSDDKAGGEYPLLALFPTYSNSCTLTYQYTSIQNAHAFEIVLEDFPRQQITLSYTDGTLSRKSPLVTRHKQMYHTPMTTAAPHSTPSPRSWKQTNTSPGTVSPLSKIPLQFAIQVDPAVHSCTEGEHLPQFLPPTPRNGEFRNAFVKQELEIRLKATATQSWVNNFIVSGPLNITKYNTISGAGGESLMRWTPTENDLGDHVPICFIAESQSGSSIFHSEMRCIIVTVGHTYGKANVICNENTMAVELEKSLIIELHEDHLRLNDASCTPISNGTHVIAAMSLSSCGTILEEVADNLIFKNEITSYDKLGDVITRENQVEIAFSCSYPKNGNVSLEFRAHKTPFVFTEKGFGKFSYQFEFFGSDLFDSMTDPKSYPIEVALGEMIYMEIQASSSIANTEIFVESCRAAPVDDPKNHIFYDIFGNGCMMDKTVVVYPSKSSEFKFGIEAFKFIGEHEEVFINCSVILCVAGDPHTRCSQDCINATAAPVVNHHHRRAVATETVRHYIFQGPLRLKKSTGITVSKSSLSLSLNMNLVFIAAVLLVGVAIVCGAVIYTAKTLKVKYQPHLSTDF